MTEDEKDMRDDYFYTEMRDRRLEENALREKDERPTPESAPQMHAAANDSIEAMFRKGCDLEHRLAEVTKQRDMLANAITNAAGVLATVKGGQR